MFGEFAKYNVLPLDASVATRMVAPRPNLSAGRKVFEYSGNPVTGIPDSALQTCSTHPIRSRLTSTCRQRRRGRIVTEGGRFGGYGLYLLKGKPVFTWNLLDLKRVKWEGPEALSPGKHKIEFDFKYDGLGFATLAFNNLSGIGRPGTGTLRSTARSLPRESWKRRSRCCFRSTRRSTSAPTPARRSMTRTIRCRSPSPARSAS